MYHSPIITYSYYFNVVYNFRLREKDACKYT